tara:strand:+ start:56 stop:1042 length:987 start_codon:yes stop_codon:yes gene_type:complete
MDNGKTKALEIAVGQINSQFGNGSIMKLGDSKQITKVESIATGSLSLDIATGINGVPKGRVTEIFGSESSGKSTLAYHIMAECQKTGGTAAYIDTEHALDPDYAKRCGVNTDSLLISQPDFAEQALEICEYLVRSGAIEILVLDSVAALVPKVELEGDMGDAHVGLQARLMSQALRKLTAAINKSNCAVLFINQIREKVGIIWGNPEVTPGGRALKFYSSLRIDLRRAESIKKGTEIIGSRVKARIVKNKVAPPFKVAEFDIMFNSGISKESDIIDIASELGLIQKSGAFYSFNEIKLGQGKENVRLFLSENSEISSQIQKLIANNNA